MKEAKDLTERLSPHMFAGAKALGNRILRDNVEKVLKGTSVEPLSTASDLDLMVGITCAIVGEWRDGSSLADNLLLSSLPLTNLLTALKASKAQWNQPGFKEAVVTEVTNAGVQLRSLFPPPQAEGMGLARS